jgi:ActR/RegA family two-component response regulator
VEAAVSLAEGAVEPELLRSLLGDTGPTAGPDPIDLDTVERRHIAKILRMTGGNKSRAAKLLGVDRRTLQRKGY